MSDLSKTIRAALAACAIFFAAGAAAQDKTESFNADEARAVAAALDRDQNMLATYQACPADVFRKEASLGALLLGDDAEVTAEHCARRPSECLSACATRRSGEHCFRLALAFQNNEATIQPRYAQIMFQMACALGKASGCTNRAAHLRNAAGESDPLTALDKSAQEKCQFRSFKLACEKDDPWGCAMLGQAYRNGEGASESGALARRYYKKSCSLNPDFAACAFSRGAMRDMAGRRR